MDIKNLCKNCKHCIKIQYYNGLYSKDCINTEYSCQFKIKQCPDVDVFCSVFENKELNGD